MMEMWCHLADMSPQWNTRSACGPHNKTRGPHSETCPHSKNGWSPQYDDDYVPLSMQIVFPIIVPGFDWKCVIDSSHSPHSKNDWSPQYDDDYVPLSMQIVFPIIVPGFDWKCVIDWWHSLQKWLQYYLLLGPNSWRLCVTNYSHGEISKLILSQENDTIIVRFLLTWNKTQICYKQ